MCVYILSSLIPDCSGNHDSQGVESHKRRTNASLLRGQPERLHAAGSLSEKGKSHFVSANGFHILLRLQFHGGMRHDSARTRPFSYSCGYLP